MKLRIEPLVAGASGMRRYVGQAAVVLDKMSEFIGVEAFVPDENHGFGQKRQ